MQNKHWNLFPVFLDRFTGRGGGGEGGPPVWPKDQLFPSSFLKAPLIKWSFFSKKWSFIKGVVLVILKEPAKTVPNGDVINQLKLGRVLTWIPTSFRSSQLVQSPNFTYFLCLPLLQFYSGQLSPISIEVEKRMAWRCGIRWNYMFLINY